MHPRFEAITRNELGKTAVFTGSIGPNFQDFRFRLKPDFSEDKVSAAVYSLVCYEKAADIEEAEFSMDDEGIAALRSWLQSRYERFCEKG